LTLSKLQLTGTFAEGEALHEYYKFLIRDRYDMSVFSVLTGMSRYQNNTNEIPAHSDKHGQRIFSNLCAVNWYILTFSFIRNNNQYFYM
jgi:hypothetical protein